jgi:hypothetical protein
MCKWFDEPHDSQRIRGFPLFATRRDHFRPGYAFKFGIRNSLTNCAYQASAEHITGCLTSNQSDPHRGILACQSTLG